MEIKSKLKSEWMALGIVVGAAVLRLLWLGIKPPHFDEGVNGYFVDSMIRNGYYHYDPTNYHGPFHFYVLFFFQVLFGRHIWALRLPLALTSTGCVWLTTRFDRFLGRNAALWGAAAMAVSPGCIFYGRYAIHEYWLVLSLMLIAWGIAGLWKFGERKYLWAITAGVTGAVLTKETYFIHFGCVLLALGCLFALEKLLPSSDGAPPARQQWTWQDIVFSALVFVGLVVFFYSGGFLDPKAIDPKGHEGLNGLYSTFADWKKTGANGNGHEKPWFYWLKLIGQYEWPCCLGLLAALASIAPGTPRVVRALAIYGCGTLMAYSIINYKTPWCIVSLTWPFLLLFGWAVDFAFRKPDYGPGIAAMASALLGANLCDSIYLNFQHYTDEKEPYVYVQTFKDVNLLMDPLNAMVARNPANYHMTGHIVVESYHPLPWLLGDFTKVGYYQEDNAPTAMDADFILVDETRIDDVESQLHDDYFTHSLHLRDAQDPLKLYLSAKKFGVLFPHRMPEFTPKAKAAPDDSPAPDATP